MAATVEGMPTTPTGKAYVIRGETVTMPLVVRDAASMTAIFLVSAPQVRRLIPDRRLWVPELFPGRALCAISAIEYRDNDLGRYNELAVAFFVRFGGQRPTLLLGLLAGLGRGEIGTYIHRLPVTTSLSRDAGRDIWGFPKIVADIEFFDDGPRRICTLVADGTHVLTLAMQRGGRRVAKDRPQDVFAWRDGMLLRTPSVMGGEGAGIRLGGATLALGAHEIADELRGLGLPRRPLISTWMEKMHGRFEVPEAL